MSVKRKNEIYKALTNTKMKYILAYEMQKEFKSYIRNVKSQKKQEEGDYESSLSGEEQ